MWYLGLFLAWKLSSAILQEKIHDLKRGSLFFSFLITMVTMVSTKTNFRKYYLQVLHSLPILWRLRRICQGGRSCRSGISVANFPLYFCFRIKCHWSLPPHSHGTTLFNRRNSEVLSMQTSPEAIIAEIMVNPSTLTLVADFALNVLECDVLLEGVFYHSPFLPLKQSDLFWLPYILRMMKYPWTVFWTARGDKRRQGPASPRGEANGKALAFFN